jgi:hypothetical protein
MFRNYVQIAFRSLLKNQVYSFINIGGLAIGLAASILIFSGLLMSTPVTSFKSTTITFIPNFAVAKFACG